MRIALVTNLATHYRRPLFTRLADRHDMDLFLTSRGRESYWLSDHDVGTATLRIRPSWPRRRLFLSLLRDPYDCVVVTLVGRAALVAALAATLIRRRPLVVWVGIWEHPGTFFHRLSRPITRAIYRRADALIVYGPHVARYIAEESGRTGNVFEVAQAVDTQPFSTVDDEAAARVREELGVSRDGTLFAYVGRLSEGKGVEYLLRAFAAVAGDADVLAVAGTGPIEQGLVGLARELQIAERVRFLGYVAQASLPPVFAAADVVVIPSVATPRHREPWGLVANEAMAAGRAVIATDAVGAVPGGLVLDGQTGLVVDERDVEQLAGALKRLAGDPKLRAELGAAAAAHVARWSYAEAVTGFEAAVAAAVEVRR